MTGEFDDLARDFAQPHVNRRRMLGRFAAVLAGAAGIGMLEAQPALAGKPGGSPNCPPGLTACGTVCRDLNVDPVNCGTCGNSCTTSQVCRGGVCVDIPCTCPVTCASGQTLCNGTCVDTSADPNNCGGCGTTCASGHACVNGTCSQCAAGQTLCNGTCVDTSADPNNCGGCGVTCGASTICRTATCSSGTCVHINTTAGTSCGPAICTNGQMTTPTCDGSGNCVNVQHSCSPYLCNSTGTGCNTTCSSSVDCVAGFTCVGGVCVPTPA